jgi:hypothetical protein
MKKLLTFLLLTLGFSGSFEGLQSTEINSIEQVAYGDISSKTGRPKTKYVQGYYRKNGTYVEGYYRSRLDQ